MSHVTQIKRNELVFICDIETACLRMEAASLEMAQRQFKSYYGVGQCDFAIRVANANYEIGCFVNSEEGTVEMKCDLYSSGGLQNVLGNNL